MKIKNENNNLNQKYNKKSLFDVFAFVCDKKTGELDPCRSPIKLNRTAMNHKLACEFKSRFTLHDHIVYRLVEAPNEK